MKNEKGKKNFFCNKKKNLWKKKALVESGIKNNKKK